MEDIVIFIIAGVFLYKAYKAFADYLVKRHDAKVKHEEELQEALTAVREYPKYRQQSKEIQNLLESEIQELRIMQQELQGILQENTERLSKMEEDNKRRERNKTRDRLLQLYRHYTNPHTNPDLVWTSVEAEVFWGLFDDYERDGGNGMMHSEVLPAMKKLHVIDE